MERSVGFFLASEKSFKAFISVLFCSELAAASPTSPWAPLQMASVRGAGLSRSSCVSDLNFCLAGLRVLAT